MEQLRKTTYILLCLGIGIALLYVSGTLLIPIAIAALLAMLFRGLAGRLEAKGWPRWLTSLFAVFIFLMAIGIVVTLLSWQLSALTENLSEMRDRFMTQLAAFRDWLQEVAGISHSEQEAMLEEQASAASAEAGGGIAAFALGTMSVTLDLVLMIVYTFLLLLYRKKIKTFILQVTPDQYRRKAEDIIGKASRVAQQYLTGLSAMIACLWVLYGIGFSIIGVEGALFFAVLCGILEIIPFVGNLLGTTITVLAVVAQGGNTTMILAVIGVYMVVQGLQTYILEPVIVGNQVNINPLFIIVVLVAGELLWGVPGMILAIPMLGIVKIICDHIDPLKPYGMLVGNGERR